MRCDSKVPDWAWAGLDKARGEMSRPESHVNKADGTGLKRGDLFGLLRVNDGGARNRVMHRSEEGCCSANWDVHRIR
jgi:hypothetical protein